MRRISVISFHLAVGAIRCEFRRASPETPMVGKITAGFFLSPMDRLAHTRKERKKNKNPGTTNGVFTDLTDSQENRFARMAGADPGPPSDK